MLKGSRARCSKDLGQERRCSTDLVKDTVQAELVQEAELVQADLVLVELVLAEEILVDPSSLRRDSLPVLTGPFALALATLPRRT